MPYVEKLKTIKEEKSLSLADISKVGDIPLATVTRVFNGQTPNPTFETITKIAIGMGVSLDELAGLKQPDEQPLASPIIETFNSYSEILKEKDERINELKEQNEKLQASFNEYKLSSEKTTDRIEKEKQDIRHEKRKITSALICVVLVMLGLGFVLVVGLLLDLLNGHIGKFRY